jgi:hypothetical protein
MDCPFCTEECTCVADHADVPDTESESSAYSVYEESVDSLLFSSDSSSEGD